MANPFKKFWDYLMALFDNKIEENADPMVQIEQAISEAQRQHPAQSQHAAAGSGRQRHGALPLRRRRAPRRNLCRAVPPPRWRGTPGSSPIRGARG